MDEVWYVDYDTNSRKYVVWNKDKKSGPPYFDTWQSAKAYADDLKADDHG